MTNTPTKAAKHLVASLPKQLHATDSHKIQALDSAGLRTAVEKLEMLINVSSHIAQARKLSVDALAALQGEQESEDA